MFKMKGVLAPFHLQINQPAQMASDQDPHILLQASRASLQLSIDALQQITPFTLQVSQP
jgi:hypothetical protein